MKIAVVGTGAIGVWLGAALARRGHDVCGLARGATLEALRRYGWRVEVDGRIERAPGAFGDSPRDLGIADAVVLAVKNDAIPLVASSVAELCDDRTVVVAALNGVPWWFPRTSARADALRDVVRDGAAIARAIPTERVFGCVVTAGTSSPEPGLSRVSFVRGLALGDVTGGKASELARILDAFGDAGLPAAASAHVHVDVWKKLMQNMIFNPLAALTRSSPRRIVADPDLRAFVVAGWGEAIAIARALALPIDDESEATLAAIDRLGDFKPSMLQDAERGRALEIEALLEVPRRIARRLDVVTPTIDTIAALARRLDASLRDG